MARARKAWTELSPDYRKRLSGKGLTAQNYNTAEGDRLRQAARGHGKTPEHPIQARRNPSRYREYNETRQDEVRQVIARKRELFEGSVKYKPGRSEANVISMPLNDGGKRAPKIAYMRRFLRMTADEVAAIDWSDDEWHFLFYH